MKTIRLLILLIVLCPKAILAQSSDSLLQQLKAAAADTQKVNVLIELSRHYAYADAGKSLSYAKEAGELSDKIKFRKGLAYSLNAEANALEELGRNEEVLQTYARALELAIEQKDHVLAGNVNSNMGAFYAKRGDYKRCLDYFLRALKVWEDADDHKNMAMQLANIGALYQLMGQFEESLSYQRRSLQLAKAAADSVRIAVACNNIGLIHVNTQSYDSAKVYLYAALGLAERHHDLTTQCNARSNLAGIFEAQEDFPRAIQFLRPLPIVFGNPYALSNAYQHLGVAMTRSGRLDSAEYYLQRSIVIADSIGALFLVKESYVSLATTYHKMGRHNEAFSYALKYASMKDTLMNQEKMQQISELSAKYETEKKELEISRLNAEKARDNIYKVALGGGLLLLLALALVLWRGYRQKQKNNRQLEIKNLLISEQKHLVEEKQKEILDSINYARRIQRAQLPTEKYMQRVLGELRSTAN